MQGPPRYAVAVDVAVFGASRGPLELLLIRRGGPPQAGSWALPGGLVLPDEELEAAALRELEEETGLRPAWIDQLQTFGRPGRDPRGRVFSVAWFALVRPEEHRVLGASDAVEAGWFDVGALPPLAFDHEEIAAVALRRLRSRLRYQPIGFELLPQHFTLSQLQALYEQVLGEVLDKRNFRKKILGMGLLNEVPEMLRGANRPARLYRFDPQRYAALSQGGFVFEI
jgi:8-oxo-dGTP diphosphatase